MKYFCRDFYREKKYKGDSNLVLIFAIHLTNDIKEMQMPKGGKGACIA